ncbi:MAG: enolase C-terminal domain-like protein [Planctomycetales bacterium]
MRPVELIAYHVRIPLKRTIRHASHARDDTDSLIACLRLDDGTLGWGEGLPRPYVTGETIDTTFTHLRQTAWGAVLGTRLAGLADAIEVARRIEPGPIPEGKRDCFGNVVRCAVELSLLDAACRATGQPLSTLTALVPETLGIRNTRPQVRYSGALTPTGPWRDRISAWKLRLFGLAQGKVKVGVPGFDDVASVSLLRRIVGERFDIRIDANEAWSIDELESRVERLRPFGITALEQPTPHAHVAGLARIRERLGIPLMLDESLCSLPDARRAIEHGTCDLFNIRLSKCGGLIRALELAALAHRAGLGYQLGCQVGETGILSAAGRHFASSVGDIRYLEGSFDRFLVRERLTVEDLTFGYGGYAPALLQPGLGVTIDRAALRRVTIREEHFPLDGRSRI